MPHEESHEGFNLTGQLKEGIHTIRQGAMNFILNRGQMLNKRAQERKVGSTYPIELKLRDAFKRNDDHGFT